MMINQLLQQILRYTMVYPHHQLLTIMKSSYIITNGPFLLIVRINYTTLYHLCSHDYSKKYGIWVFFSMGTQTTRSFLVRNSSGKLTVISQLFLQSGQIPQSFMQQKWMAAPQESIADSFLVGGYQGNFAVPQH